eukprot:CAMPEP_0179037892 /NCGR_PEP_ID=MMETSP0796-20121207/14357_1 /TAXON_ID=73915 /ORGANISM="Pyrodinium bahamense, Strain pbaha01" /LENGTH=273 /DNA_ID=CAMNT_0020734203 /DNA_START=41 /DNA_END=862 /DNA_ORIENTATION=-
MASTVSRTDGEVAPSEVAQQEHESASPEETADPASDNSKPCQSCYWVCDYETAGQHSEVTKIWAMTGVAPPRAPKAAPQGRSQTPAAPPTSPPPTAHPAGSCAPEPTPVAPTEQGLPTPLKQQSPLPPGCTTLLVRNIPARLNKERILVEWPVDGTFNYLYLHYHPGWPRGEASINFLTPELALAFQLKWHGQCLSTPGRAKPLVVAAAPVQGVRDNLKALLHKGSAKGGREDHLPALFYGTWRVNAEAVLSIMRSEQDQAHSDFVNFSRISL